MPFENVTFIEDTKFNKLKKGKFVNKQTAKEVQENNNKSKNRKHICNIVCQTFKLSVSFTQNVKGEHCSRILFGCCKKNK